MNQLKQLYIKTVRADEPMDLRGCPALKLLHVSYLDDVANSLYNMATIWKLSPSIEMTVINFKRVPE